MRVLIDTNVLISFVIKPSGQTPPTVIVRAALGGTFELMMSEHVLDELADRLTNKPSLKRLVRAADVSTLVDTLRNSGTVVHRTGLASERPISRDPDDDTVLLDAAFAAVDFLVTGDADLLVIEHFAGVRIVSPADFLTILNA